MYNNLSQIIDILKNSLMINFTNIFLHVCAGDSYVNQFDINSSFFYKNGSRLKELDVICILMVNITIREASENDILVILEILYELGRPKPRKNSDVDTFRKLVKKYITDSDKKIPVAVFDDKITGIVSMIFLQRLNQNTLELYIPELIVFEKYRHRGIGKKLINSCVNLAKEKKCHRIRLESGILRKESHQFYMHLGFEQSAFFFTKNLERITVKKTTDTESTDDKIIDDFNKIKSSEVSRMLKRGKSIGI